MAHARSLGLLLLYLCLVTGCDNASDPLPGYNPLQGTKHFVLDWDKSDVRRFSNPARTSVSILGDAALDADLGAERFEITFTGIHQQWQPQTREYLDEPDTLRLAGHFARTGAIVHFTFDSGDEALGTMVGDDDNVYTIALNLKAVVGGWVYFANVGGFPRIYNASAGARTYNTTLYSEGFPWTGWPNGSIGGEVTFYYLALQLRPDGSATFEVKYRPSGGIEAITRVDARYIAEEDLLLFYLPQDQRVFMQALGNGVETDGFEPLSDFYVAGIRSVCGCGVHAFLPSRGPSS